MDSIELAWRVSQLISQDVSSVLDLGAGCGVIGFEILFHCPWIETLNSVEIQKSEYETHYIENKKRLLKCQPLRGKNPQIKISWENYANFNTNKKYDLILANPPYFEVGNGKLSPSAFKNRCRFHMDASFTDFVDAATRNLSEKGTAFIILRQGVEHGTSLLNQIKTQIENRYTFNKLEPIRTSEFIQIKRNT